MRKLIHRYIPVHFHDPFGLAIRLIRSKDSAAWFAMATSALGILCTPLDCLLQIAEKRLYQKASAPRQPLIFVVGAPRTGTTLVSQVLINHLPVCFINNLTAVFPRSPITANLLFGKFLPRREITYKSFYGKSTYFSGPNDALHIWDRWLGKDRTRIPGCFTAAQQEEMQKFFGAYEQAFKKPVLNKNNNLNMCADLIADVFERAHFICMTRDPLYLAQSLLIARIQIHGDPTISYGIDRDDKAYKNDTDFVRDVCEQVIFHENRIHSLQEKIGKDKFWIVEYERFCENPQELVDRVSREVLGEDINVKGKEASIEPFNVSSTVRIDAELFEKLERTVNSLRQGSI